jgi:hypothetical protein
MSFFGKLFEKGEDPLPVFNDPELGRMEWSQDDEAWTGSYRGLQFALSYSREASPSSAVLSYAKEVLNDPDWLNRTLQEEKDRWSSKVPPNVKPELAELRFGVLYFSIHKRRGPIIFAIVDGGKGYRCWRIEYHGRECDGMGLDT